MEAQLRDKNGRPLITVAVAAAASGFTPSYVRRLLRTGVLVGIKIGRDWFTTQEALRAYLATERRPGPRQSEEE
jgi:hypothetical protein